MQEWQSDELRWWKGRSPFSSCTGPAECSAQSGPATAVELAALGMVVPAEHHPEVVLNIASFGERRGAKNLEWGYKNPNVDAATSLN